MLVMLSPVFLLRWLQKERTNVKMWVPLVQNDGKLQFCVSRLCCCAHKTTCPTLTLEGRETLQGETETLPCSGNTRQFHSAVKTLKPTDDDETRHENRFQHLKFLDKWPHPALFLEATSKGCHRLSLRSNWMLFAKPLTSGETLASNLSLLKSQSGSSQTFK